MPRCTLPHSPSVNAYATIPGKIHRFLTVLGCASANSKKGFDQLSESAVHYETAHLWKDMEEPSSGNIFSSFRAAGSNEYWVNGLTT